MDNTEIDARLAALNGQGYPLSVTEEDAEALVECISRIMAAIPGDDRPFVRADYSGVTSAIHHPTTPEGFGTSNERLRSPYRMP